MKKPYELSTFSHEINNSLTLIYGQLQYIENTNDLLKADPHWVQVKEDFSSLFEMIHQFLAPKDTMSAAMEPINLMELIGEVQSSWSHRMQNENIEFLVQADHPGIFYVYGAKPKLLQIFHNLIANAIHAIQRKQTASASKNITIHLSKEQGHVVLNLSDTGIGMTKEQQSRVFYQGVSFTPGGNGVGLSVVQKIADDLHVKIHMDSAIHHGTTFTLVFPARERIEPLPV